MSQLKLPIPTLKPTCAKLRENWSTGRSWPEVAAVWKEVTRTSLKQYALVKGPAVNAKDAVGACRPVNVACASATDIASSSLTSLRSCTSTLPAPPPPPACAVAGFVAPQL